jgi:selenoprotein W-related protein
VSLVNDLLKKFEPEIETVTLIPSNGGRFEVNANDTLVYSKLQTGRHAEQGEVVLLIEKILNKK